MLEKLRPKEGFHGDGGDGTVGRGDEKIRFRVEIRRGLNRNDIGWWICYWVWVLDWIWVRVSG